MPVPKIPGYTPERGTAAELGQSLRTIREWRTKRIGPPWIKIERFIHYGDESRAKWLRSREVKPIREYEPA